MDQNCNPILKTNTSRKIMCDPTVKVARVIIFDNTHFNLSEDIPNTFRNPIIQFIQNSYRDLETIQ